MIYQRLCEIAGAENVCRQEPMSRHTTFRIGGPADYFVLPHSSGELAAVIALCRESAVPWYVIGNGSNLLVGDKGVRGVVIQLFKNFQKIVIEEETAVLQAGVINSLAAKRLLDAELTGFEFAAGIPGTIGGAVVMNAGAYGGEMKDIVSSVTVLDENGALQTLPADELEFGYRTSIVARRGYVVTEVTLALQRGCREEIAARMEELKERRITKQPLEYPSAGSTFKRPEGYFAGKLIMDAGLRGFSVGGAQVSEKHCGFVINTGGATAADVAALMEAVQDTVEKKFGVRLEPEVKRLGEF